MNTPTIDMLEKEVLAAAEHVPFGNSAFQIRHFTGGNESPAATARRTRTLLLNLDAKIATLRENQFAQEEHQIDLDEADAKLADPDLDPFERRRLELTKRRAVSGVGRAAKLLRDTLAEIDAMCREWKTLPPIVSRDEFERQEQRYWVDRLVSNALVQLKSGGRVDFGTMEALQQIGVTDVQVGESGVVNLFGPAVESLVLEDQKREAAR